MVKGFEKLNPSLREEISLTVDELITSLMVRCNDYQEYYHAIAWLESAVKVQRAGYENLNKEFLSKAEIRSVQQGITLRTMLAREQCDTIHKNLKGFLGDL